MNSMLQNLEMTLASILALCRTLHNIDYTKFSMWLAELEVR